MKIWICKIGEVDAASLPDGADLPMRRAVCAAYVELTGQEPDFCFSGWGGKLDEPERAAHEKREPSEEYRQEWLLHQAAPDLLAALRLLVADVADYEPWRRPCNALDVSRAAIAKAEGR